MIEPTPRETVEEMILVSADSATEMLGDMTDEDCVDMVRSFCKTMADWQPNIACHLDDPTMLGLSCLTAAHLFQLAFARAYIHTDQKIEAINAIEKALGGNQ